MLLTFPGMAMVVLGECAVRVSPSWFPWLAPFGLTYGLGWTVLAVGVVSWLVLGIDSIGQLLEQPFSQPKDNGDRFDFGLPVESLAKGVADEIERLCGEELSAAGRER